MPGPNLRGIANAAIQSINPDTIVTILRATGTTKDSNGNRTPTYEPYQARAQVQSASYSDRAQLDGLQITGITRVVYLEAAVATAIRIQKTGGDAMVFPPGVMPEDIPDPVTGRSPLWQITAVLEAYGSIWRKVAVTLQATYSPV